MKTNNKGFSLVELIVVIAIMAILAAVAIPTFAVFITRANESSDVSFVNDFAYAAELAHATSGDDVTNVQVTVSGGAITGAKYMVGETLVEITVTNGEATVASDDADVAKAAAIVEDTVDWSYTFKSEKTGTFCVTSDRKELDTAGELETETETETDAPANP